MTLNLFFYVLMYMGCVYTGPGNQHRPANEIPEVIQEWFKTTSMEHLACIKDGMLNLLEENFERCQSFTDCPCFQDLFNFQLMFKWPVPQWLEENIGT